MRLGKHNEEQTEWKIGNMAITESDSYKYLGDIVTSDGKNSKNLTDRKNKMKTSIVTIHTIAFRFCKLSANPRGL